MLNLLDRDKNFNILLAGIFSIIIGVGVSRFAFTTLLPPMLEDFISINDAGIFASINFAGYLSGAIFSIFLKDINVKVKYFRIGIVLDVLTTFVLAFSTDYTLWFISRIFAGFASAFVILIGGSIVMEKLDMPDKTKAMGIHFTGIGLAITSCDLISKYVLTNGLWSDAWMALSIFGLIIALYTMHILSYDKESKKNASSHKVNFAMFTPYVNLLILAYFTAGVGFVVQATFFPDIINSIKGLEGFGGLGWLIVGLCGIPSAIIWMRLAHKFGSVNIIMIVSLLQIIGILLPTMSNSVFFNLLSGALYGSTFIGHVALFMHYGGKLAGKNPVIFMGSMTAAYGIGQVAAPLYSVYLIEKFGSYNPTLYVTASIVFVGVLLLAYAKKLN